jgi:hypothetical protein
MTTSVTHPIKEAANRIDAILDDDNNPCPSYIGDELSEIESLLSVWLYENGFTGAGKQDYQPRYDAMLAALRFALPFMEDLAGSSDNQDERRAAQLMRDALSQAEKKQ